MKTLIKILCITLIYLSSLNAKENLSLGNEVKEYDQIFEKIAEKRIGIEMSKIDKLDNPFVIIHGTDLGDENNASAQPIVYILEATFDQKAKINGTWYKIKDKIDIWKLTKISHNSVILQSENEKKEIFIRTKDERNIKILTK